MTSLSELYEPERWGTSIADYVRQGLAVVAWAVANGLEGAWVDKPQHRDPAALRSWLRAQPVAIQKSFNNFQVIELLDELRLNYWGNAALELSALLPGLLIRRNISTIVYRRRPEVFRDKWNREEPLFRMAGADVTRTVTVQAIEPAYRLLYPLMKPDSREWIDRAIAEHDASSVLYATLRAQESMYESEMSKALVTAPPIEADPNIGCDLLFTYDEEWLITDEELGPNNPCEGPITRRYKPTRVHAGADPLKLRELIARIALGDLLDHDIRHEGAFRI